MDTPGHGPRLETDAAMNIPAYPRAVRLTLLPLMLLQFPLDALLGRVLLFDSYAWLRALGYQLSHQPWYAFYAEDFLLGQRALGEPALWLGGALLVLRPLGWALALTWAARWLIRRRSSGPSGRS